MIDQKGALQIRRLNLMGYTPTTQVFIVTNLPVKSIPGSSTANFHFLKKISAWLINTTSGWGIEAPRLPRFKAYCEANGFAVEDAGWTP